MDEKLTVERTPRDWAQRAVDWPRERRPVIVSSEPGSSGPWEPLGER
jgi:hypothetical protein